jgi:glutamyl-Q tRNA(Asp) synthetase
MQPVLRFAPSPNGFLHLGHAYSALLNAAIAERIGGRLLLRIEDIDPLRSRPEFEAAIHEDLAWLGIRHETPVRRQSRHIGDYAAALTGLRHRGLLYPCFCSRGETARFVAEREAGGAPWPRDPDGAPFHAGPCRSLETAEANRRIAAGEPHSWRLLLDHALAVADAGALGPGWRSFDPESLAVTEEPGSAPAWGDVVLGRKDVPTSYHLSVVLDDALQGVTHVVRGEDLRAATAVHALLQRLLGLPSPLYHHHGVVLDEEGRKLSKSIASTALRSLRAEGVTAEQVRRRLGFG